MEPDPKKVTLVTFYFDLISREEGRAGVSKKYLALGDHILDLDVNLFIIADPKIAVRAWRGRQKRGLLHKTFIIPIEFEDVPYYRYRPAIEKSFATGKRPTGLFPKKDTPLYFLLGWSKFWALKQATDLNPFQSKIFAWIDYGLFHLWPNQSKPMQTMLLNNLAQLEIEKIKITTIAETHPEEASTQIYYTIRQCKLISGYFGGGKEVIEWFCDQFDRELQRCLDSGHPNLEESIMSAIHAHNKDKFITYYGDYADLISTHIGKISNFAIIIGNMKHCRNWKMWTEMLAAYHQVVNAVESKHSTPSVFDLLAIYDETLIAGWYAGKLDVSRDAANRLIKLVMNNRTSHPHINWDHYNNNLSFHGLKLVKPKPDENHVN